MNKVRRHRLYLLYDEITALQERLEEVMNEEQEAYDNLPEPLQYTERGETMEAAIQAIQEAIDNLGYAADNIEEVIT